MTAGYLMESDAEGARLRDKTEYAFSKSNLIQAGLKPGMSSIDIGCGIGLLTRVMHELSCGSVTVGVDASAERIHSALRDTAPDASISFVHADAQRIPLEANSFDFAWSRFLFEYLTDPAAVLREMIRLTRPGGTVAVADLDGQMLGFHPQSEAVSEHLGEAMKLLKRAGFDPFVGRKLFSLFRSCSLRQVTATVIPYQIYCGGLPPNAKTNWNLKLSAAVKRLEQLDATRNWQSFAQAMMDDLDREDAFYYSIMILVCGTKSQM